VFSSDRFLRHARRVRFGKPAAATLITRVAFGVGFAAFLAVFILSIAPYFAFRPTKGASEAEFNAELDRTVPKILRHFHIPGVVIATVVNGAPSKIYAYGYANLERREPMTAATVFRVASISKSLTAWGVLRLAEQGKIRLDGPAQIYLEAWPLPPSPFPSSAVTVRQLLNHTSGLNAGADTFRRPSEPVKTAAEILSPRRGDPDPNASQAALIAPAGRDFVYSVPGYTILQMLIEHQSGQLFSNYMTASVLRPLGMASSSFQWDERLSPRLATPYMADGRPGPVIVPQDLAADSLVSTGEDIARFIAAPMPDLKASIGAGVLQASSVDQLYSQPVKIPSLALGGLAPDLPALGYFVERTAGQPEIVTNGGYDPGWSSRFYMAPATGDGVVILTNSDLGQPAIAQIASIWSTWRGLPVSMMTRLYRTVGLAADVLISLLIMLGVALGANLVIELRVATGRSVGVTWQGIRARLLEILLTAGAVGTWTEAHATIRALPGLNLLGTSAAIFFASVVLARVFVAPRTKPEPAPNAPEGLFPPGLGIAHP
jgi:CubicO group peptidase (beta-lactamase class C family)